MDLQSKDTIQVILKQEETTREAENSITLKDMIQAILRGKQLILITTIATLLITFLAAYFINPYGTIAKSAIALNFEGIEKGLDPHGKKFDFANIKSINVLEQVINSLDLKQYNLNAEMLRRQIEIEPIIPGDITEKIKKIKEAKKENIQEQQEFIYYPNQFILSLAIPRENGVDAKKDREILDEVIRQYETYFFNTYTDQTLVGNAVGKIDYKEYDYPEVSRVVNNQIDIMKSYLDSKIKVENGGVFRSKETGLSFTDIVQSLDVLKDVDVGRLDSLIGAFNLTKNKENLIKLYEYRIKMLYLNKSKKSDESRLVSEVLGKYQKDKSILLMPGTTNTNASGAVELENKDSYYDTLSERLTDTGVESTNAFHEIAFYQAEIEKFKNDTVAIESKKIAEKEVVSLIGLIQKKLDNWVKTTNVTVSEYYRTEKFNRAIQKLSPAETYAANENFRLIMVMSVIIGFFIGVLLSFFMEYWRRNINGSLKEQLDVIKQKFDSLTKQA